MIRTIDNKITSHIMDIYRVESHELQRNCFKEHDDLISAAKVEDESLKSDPTLLRICVQRMEMSKTCCILYLL